MLMIPARLGRSESFWAVVKVRSPHTGPGISYIIWRAKSSGARQCGRAAAAAQTSAARSSSAPSVLAKRSQRAMVADGSPIGVYYRAITEAGWNFRAITLGWSGIWGLETSPR